MRIYGRSLGNGDIGMSLTDDEKWQLLTQLKNERTNKDKERERNEFLFWIKMDDEKNPGHLDKEIAVLEQKLGITKLP